MAGEDGVATLCDNAFMKVLIIRLSRRDSTDGKVAALCPKDPGSIPVDSYSMLQRALANNE